MNQEQLLGARKPRTAIEIILLVLSVFYLFWKTPIVAYYMNTYVAMSLLVAMLAFFLLQDRACRKTPPVLLMVTFLYAIFDAYNLLLNKTSILNILWTVFLAVMPVFVGVIIVANKMDYLVRVLVPVIILLYAITAATTYIGLLQFPDASRIMAADSTAYIKYFPRNIGSFNFIYSLTLLHPLIICVLKEKKHLILSFAFTIISAMAVFKSDYTTAALLFLISCIAYFFPSRTSNNRVRAWGLLLSLAIVVLIFFVPTILDGLAEVSFLYDSSDKLRDVANILRGGNASDVATKARIRVYERSWNTFLEYPFWGATVKNANSVGGHSFFLDILAKWGILGFSLVGVLYFFFRRLHRRICGGATVSYYAFLFMCMIVIICILNPHAWLFELGFAAPVFLQYATTAAESPTK